MEEYECECEDAVWESGFYLVENNKDFISIVINRCPECGNSGVLGIKNSRRKGDLDTMTLKIYHENRKRCCCFGWTRDNYEYLCDIWKMVKNSESILLDYANEEEECEEKEEQRTGSGE